MKSPSRLRRTSSSLLVIIFLAAVCREIGAGSWSIVISGTGWLIFIGLEWRQMAGVAKATFMVAIAIFAVLASQGQISLDLIEKAFVRATFFSFFVTSLDILRSAAQTSPMIRHCGKLIIDQPPGRRYAVLTYGGHMFGILLNMGALNLLGTMVRRSIDSDQVDVEDRIREMRLQRMTMALMRGFCALPLWAPTSVAVVLVLTGLPDTTWFDVAPYAMTTAFIYISFGWFIDRLSFPRPRIIQKAGSLRGVLYSLLPLLALNVVVLGTAFLLSWLSPLRLIGALLICVPIFGIGWLIIQRSSAGLPLAFRMTGRRLAYKVVPGLSDLRTEICVLASSAFISIVLLPQIDVTALSDLIMQNGLGAGAVLVMTLWFISIAGPLGFNPIISVSLAVETLASLPGLHISPVLILMTCTLAWALVTGVSPFSAAERLTSRCIRKSPFVIGPRWNMVFTLSVLISASIFLLIAA